MQGTKADTGLPEDIKERIQTKKEEPKAPEKVPEVQPEVEPNERIDAENTFGIEFSDEEITNYLFHGHVSKKVDIIPGMFKVTLKTLSGDECDAVDIVFVKEVNQTKRSAIGASDLRNMMLAAKALTHVNDKAMPDDFETRYKDVRNMGALVIDKISKACGEMTLILSKTLDKKLEVKNLKN